MAMAQTRERYMAIGPASGELGALRQISMISLAVLITFTEGGRFS